MIGSHPIAEALRIFEDPHDRILHNADLLKSLGATHVIDRKADFVSETNKISDGDSVDLIYDAVGSKEVQIQALEVLASGGQLIDVAHAQVDKAAYPDKNFITLFADFRLPQFWPLGNSLFSKLHDLLASGAIKVSINCLQDIEA